MYLLRLIFRRRFPLPPLLSPHPVKKQQLFPRPPASLAVCGGAYQPRIPWSSEGGNGHLGKS